MDRSIDLAVQHMHCIYFSYCIRCKYFSFVGQMHCIYAAITNICLLLNRNIVFEKLTCICNCNCTYFSFAEYKYSLAFKLQNLLFSCKNIFSFPRRNTLPVVANQMHKTLSCNFNQFRTILTNSDKN